MHKIALLAFAISLSACHTIHFTKSNDTAVEFTTQQWHHTGIFGLVEFSEPYNVKEVCEGKDWTLIETDRKFLQGFISGLTYNLYSPVNIAVNCP